MTQNTQHSLTKPSEKKKKVYTPYRGAMFTQLTSQEQSLTRCISHRPRRKSHAFARKTAYIFQQGSQEQSFTQQVSTPGVEPGLSRPQRDVLTTRRCRPCWCIKYATLLQKTKPSPKPRAYRSGCLGLLTTRRPRGVTVSTLDSESSDRGSNPREALCSNEPPG